MKLPVTKFGDHSGVPVVLAPGLFGMGKNLAGLARTLSTNRTVYTVDLRNHGVADWADVHDYPSMALDLYETFAEMGQIDLMGHSMGGKAAMMLALKHPKILRRLIIADMAPVAYEHSHSGHIAAMQALNLSEVKNRRDADVGLRDLIPEVGIRAFLLHGLEIGANGARWRNNLTVLDEYMPAIVGWPEVSGRFTGETLFIGGANSDYIAQEHRETIKEYFPKSKVTMLKDAGHWLHAEKPALFAQLVGGFLAPS